VQFIKGKVKAVPGYAMKAYWGEEVQLHKLTSALDGGEFIHSFTLFSIYPYTGKVPRMWKLSK